MPKMKNCPECGKLFVDMGFGKCNDCIRKDEEEENSVRKYLQEHRSCTVKEIHEATKVKESVIVRMIKEGRLIGDTEIGYPCDRCGRLITKGRYCDKCSKELQADIGKINKNYEARKKTQNNNNKIHNRGIYLK